MRVARNWFIVLLLFCCLFAVSSSNSEEEKEKSGFCSGGGVNKMATTLGGLKDSNPNSNSNDLAQFAVTQHNTNNNVSFELVRVIKSQEQVVAGTLHHLTLEVLDAGNKKIYEAKIWVKPWLNFKELKEFTHVQDLPSFTSSDLGAKKGEHVSGWKSVPVHDPVVQDAANHAVNTIRQRSNSLLPYTLNEILHANAEVVDASAKFDMLLKVNRGDKEEKFKVEVHRNNEGAFHLYQMEAAAADHS